MRYSRNAPRESHEAVIREFLAGDDDNQWRTLHDLIYWGGVQMTPPKLRQLLVAMPDIRDRMGGGRNPRREYQLAKGN